MTADLSFDETVERLCVLEDPGRRAAYAAVRQAAEPLTRAEVATRADMSHRLAAFHLEKLLEAGYLEVVDPPPSRARRIGHPPKHYRPTKLELDVSIPPRRYDLVAEMLAVTLAERDEGSARLESDDVAQEYGRRIGAAARGTRDEPRFLAALRDAGYEPVEVDDDVVLRNCPFHHAARSRPEVVCRINCAFVTGLLAGARARRTATLQPAAGRCCVVVTPPAPTGSA